MVVYRTANETSGYIYMIDCGEFTKIGLSIKPQQRFDDLNATVPFDMYLVHTMKTKNMKRAEKYLHTNLAQYRTKGEWFRLPEHIYYHLKSITDIDSYVLSGNLL